MANRVRADQRLVELGLAATRSAAQRLLMAGQVFAGERRIDKPGAFVAPNTELRLLAPERYVSRGGLKLEAALDDLQLDVSGLVVADLGASTGGFTDCVLQRGAAKVYAVDVGRAQLHDKLRRDPRVVVMDGTNARHLGPNAFDPLPELVLVDASFIGLAKLLDAIHRILAPAGRCLALVKPQFEAGRREARRGRGVIRDPVVRQAAIDGVSASIRAAGFELSDQCACAVAGPKGNREEFVLFRAR